MGCKHVNELIWPWQRAFLLHFENALNAVKKPGAPTITLPYWDWTEPVSGNNGFPAPYDDIGTPLGVQQRLMRHADIKTTMNTYGSAF